MAKARPTAFEITIRKDIEGDILPIDIEYPKEAIALNEIPDFPKAEANLALLIAYLRSDIPISDYMRNWLADMLEPEPETPLRLTLSDIKSTASKKRQQRSNIIRRHAALFACAWMKKHTTDDKDAAIHETKPQYNLGKTTLNKAIDDQKMLESITNQVRIIRK
jgi:hypothetical protein